MPPHTCFYRAIKKETGIQNSAEDARERDNTTTCSNKGNKGETHAVPWQMFCEKTIHFPTFVWFHDVCVCRRVDIQRAASEAKYLTQLSAENRENSIYFDLFFWISNSVFQAPLIPLTATINVSEVSPKICFTSLFCPSRTLISNLLTLRAAKENENLCEKDKSIQSSYSYSAKHLICM